MKAVAPHRHACIAVIRSGQCFLLVIVSRKQLALTGLLLLLHLLNFRCQLGDRKDPFLTGQRVESALAVKYQYHIAGDHQRELRQWLLHGGEKTGEGIEAFANALHRNARIQQAPGGAQDDKIGESVAGVSTPGDSVGENQAGFAPVVELATAQPGESGNLLAGETTLYHACPLLGNYRKSRRLFVNVKKKSDKNRNSCHFSRAVEAGAPALAAGHKLRPGVYRWTVLGSIGEVRPS